MEERTGRRRMLRRRRPLTHGRVEWVLTNLRPHPFGSQELQHIHVPFGRRVVRRSQATLVASVWVSALTDEFSNLTHRVRGHE